jgi:hypothetical protein
MTFKYSIQNFLLFVAVFLLQVMVFNNVNVYGLGFPMVYVLIILLIPVLQPAWFVLLVSFLIGLSMDFFTDTGGLHAAAATLMAFARIFVLQRMEPQAGYSKDDRPGLLNFRMNWLAVYFGMLIAIHHLFYFILEEGSLYRLVDIVLKTAVSSALTLILILVLNIFLFRR